jgi:exopolysaccharide production repressor protein
MYFPQFLVGMFATSFIVAIWADIQTGSVWKALGWAILAMIILQVGYVGLVVRLIYKRGSKGTEASQASANSTPSLHGDGLSL